MTDYVHDPNRRQRYVFQEDGDNLIAEIWVEPGGDVPTHYHPALEERWTVLEGQVRFKVGKRKVAAGPGDELVGPPGIKHSFKNVGGEEAHLRVHVRPAGKLRAFLEEAAALSRAGKYTRRNIPTGPRAALEVSEFADRYRDTTVVSQPPPFVQRLLAGLQRRLAAGK
jgi:mannose-6-phosphate isomerase-like protein (cupin superfamily)